MLKKIFIPQREFNNSCSGYTRLPSSSFSFYGYKRSLGLQYFALSGYIAVIVFFMLLGYAVSVGYGDVLGYANNIKISDLLKYTNEDRLAASVGEVVISDRLSKAAENKARDMFENDYWAHVSPSGTEPWDFFDGVGYDYIYAGENLAVDFQDSESVVKAWMNSPTHKENLLNGNYTEIGFAVVNGNLKGRDTTLVVQLFAKPRNIEIVSVKDVTAEPSIQEVSDVNNTLPSGPLTVPSEQGEDAIVEVPVVTTEVGNAVEGRVLNSAVVFNVSKYIALIIGLFLSLLFAVDAYYIRMYGINRVSGKTFFHILLLILVVLGIWYTNVGLVL